VVVVEESFRLVHFGLLLNEPRCASKIKGIEKAAWKKSKNVNSTRGEAMRDERNNEEMDSVCDRYISHAFGRNRPFQESSPQLGCRTEDKIHLKNKLSSFH
jgi:hypothetical protein